MQILKVTAGAALATVLVASAAFAGSQCGSNATKASAPASAAAAGCCASKQAAASACNAKHTEACGGMMQQCKIEATRSSTGDLVVHYKGTTPEAVAYLQNQAAISADKFCCPMTQKMATNEACNVKLTKVEDGIKVVVSSQKREVVDAFEKEFAALTVPARQVQ